MKNIKDLVPFCVPTKGLTQEQGDKLFDKFIDGEAYGYEPYSDNYGYFGVDCDVDTMCWDDVESFSASEGIEVKIIPYDRIDEFLGLVDEDLSTPVEDLSSTPKSAAKQARDSDVIATPLILPAEDGGVRDTRRNVNHAESFNTLETLQSLCKEHSLSITIDGGEVVVRSIVLDKEFSVGTMQEITKVTDALAVVNQFIIE